jgi:hypothetical protein
MIAMNDYLCEEKEIHRILVSNIRPQMIIKSSHIINRVMDALKAKIMEGS